MKSRVRWLSLAGLCALVAGCVPSLQPLYTPETIAFDPALVGAWCQTNKQDRWEFSKKDGNAYKLIYTDNEKRRAEFTAYLVRVQSRFFLDLYPEDSDAKLNDLFATHLLPVHTFLWVQQVEPAPHLAMMRPDVLKKQLEAQPGAVKHEPLKDNVLLTAAPKELQAFLAAADLKALFGDVTPLVPAPPQPVAKP